MQQHPRSILDRGSASWFVSALALTLALPCAGCASTAPAASPKQGPPPNAEPKPEAKAEPESSSDRQLKDAFEREAGELPLQAIQGPEGSFSAKVPAHSAPLAAKSEDGVVTVEISLGGQQPLHCQVFGKALDAGGTLGRLISGAGQKVEFKSVKPWAVTVAGQSPAAWLEAVYVADVPGGKKAAGHLKMAVLARSDRPVLCLHDEPGYRKTFERVVQAFFESYAPSAPPNSDSIYSEVHSIRIGQVPVGFGKSELTKDDAGKPHWATVSMMMLPVGPSQVRFEDSYVTQVLDADYGLQSGRWVKATNGEITLNVDLKRSGGALYRYEGKVQGKPVQGEFRTQSKRALPSALGTARFLKKHAKKSGAFEVSLQEYMPALDPTAPQKTTYSRAADAPLRAVMVQTGAMQGVTTMDDNGMFEDAKLSIGSTGVLYRRELVKGQF